MKGRSDKRLFVYKMLISDGRYGSEMELGRCGDVCAVIDRRIATTVVDVRPWSACSGPAGQHSRTADEMKVDRVLRRSPRGSAAAAAASSFMTETQITLRTLGAIIARIRRGPALAAETEWNVSIPEHGLNGMLRSGVHTFSLYQTKQLKYHNPSNIHGSPETLMLNSEAKRLSDIPVRSTLTEASDTRIG